MCFNKNNKNTQQYFQEAFGFTLFAVIHCPRASSLSSTYCNNVAEHALLPENTVGRKKKKTLTQYDGALHITNVARMFFLFIAVYIFRLAHRANA